MPQDFRERFWPRVHHLMAGIDADQPFDLQASSEYFLPGPSRATRALTYGIHSPPLMSSVAPVIARA